MEDWLSGESLPTLRQVEQLARTTATPVGFFFLPEPPDAQLSIPHFRTLSDSPLGQPSPDLLETIQTMERRQEWMREYLVQLGHDSLSFVRSARLADEPEQLAGELRTTLGLDQGWSAQQPTWSAALRVLQTKMEDAGILVVVNGVVGNNTHRKLDVAKFLGFVLVDEYAPLVFVNGADGKAAQMFTQAHELAHLWFGGSAAFDLRELQPAENEVELACNRVAAEFLVPAAGIQQVWSSVGLRPDRFQAIARHFKVSELVGARRAQDLGLITKPEFLEFYEEYRESKRRTAAQGQEGSNFYATQNLRLGRHFAGTVVRAVREGKLLYREAYTLTGLNGKTFDRYATLLTPGAAV